MSNEERIHILEEKRKKINSVSCSFCTAKWLQTTLLLQNGYNHSCHHPAPHKIPLDEVIMNPSALHNSNYKKAQRAKMLNGERPEECSYCWKIEDLENSFFSDRHYKTSDEWAWPRFDEIARSNPQDDVYPSYLEVSFSNACNFACAYCSPEISSKWMEDIKQNGSYPTKHGAHDLNYMKQVGKIPYRANEDNPYIDAFWKWFPEAIKYLKVLRITGGEPTMSKDTWRLLDFLIDEPNLKLDIAINTNLGVPDNLIDRLIEKINLLQSKGINVDIYTSLESTGAQAEYARDGLDYDLWIKNSNRILKETNAKLPIMTTINILSLPTFTNFIELIMELRSSYNLGFDVNRVPMSINIMHWPPHLHSKLLDKSIRDEYATDIEQTAESWLKYYKKHKYARIYLEEYDQIKRLCEYLRTTEVDLDGRREFVKFINAYDNRRKKDFVKVFPEYTHLLKNWSM